MEDKMTASFRSRLKQRLEFIYKDKYDETILEKAANKIEKYLPRITRKVKGWNESDVILITYGDSIKQHDIKPLKTLCRFCKSELREWMSVIHILPFFPYSSDDGFSVIDYYKVRHELGDWEDIKAMQHNFDIMADMAINHNSVKSEWFQNFLHDRHPGKDFYIACNPAEDFSRVIRPRSTPLLTAFDSEAGKKYVWTTFSEDQADLNFANPTLFIEMLEILLFYLSQGIRVIRLDAIAFLWKKSGTTCLHLPETHEFVKLFRDLFDFISPHLVLLTETNVPNNENLSYFGNGDEAHMVYQFSMPPLLLYSFFAEDAGYFNQWASQLPKPPAKATYFNFTASHDGIGVRQLEEIVCDEDKTKLFRKIEELGGVISQKTNADGSTGPYEMNITYFDALRETRFSDQQYHHERFVSSQMVMAAFQGVPAFYIHSLLATENDQEGFAKTRRARSLNRKIWNYKKLSALLNSQTHHRLILQKLLHIISLRKQQPAFHPDAEQIWLDTGHFFIAFIRKSKTQEILHLTNVTHTEQRVFIQSSIACRELICVENFTAGQFEAAISPFETRWFSGMDFKIKL
jgi:sucrose phosphorylase